MKARDLAVDYPAVALDTSALEAARLLSERRLPGLVVLDERQRPCAVLPGSQILRFALPRYVQDDPALARVYDEEHADRLFALLGRRRVRDVLPNTHATAPIVDAEATVMEIAAVMTETRSPLVAVVDAPAGKRGPLLGVVTMSRLLARLLPPT